MPTCLLYPVVSASYAYSYVFTGGVYETIGSALHYGLTVDLGSTIDRNIIGTYNVELIFISYTNVDDRSTYSTVDGVWVEFTVVDPCTNAVADCYDI